MVFRQCFQGSGDGDVFAAIPHVSRCLLWKLVPVDRHHCFSLMPVTTYRDLAMLSPRAAPFNRPGWIFELKYDGFRVLADRRGDLSRRGNDWIACYPELAVPCSSCRRWCSTGNWWCWLDAHGKAQFEPLRRRLALKTSHLS